MPDFFNKNDYKFDYIHESEIAGAYCQAWKDAGKKNLVTDHAEDLFFHDLKKNVLQKFLQDCFHADGLTHGVIAAPMLQDNGDFRIFTSDAAKNHPKRANTVTLAEQMLNFASLGKGDYFLKTDLFYFSKHNSYGAGNIKACCTMAIDIDDCGEMYNLPIEEWEEYIFAKYPLFKKFCPTYLIASGNKGFHALYCFDNNANDVSGMFLLINRLLALIFGADLLRIGTFNSIRLPYSINQKSDREARIFYRGEVMRYETLRNDVLDFAENKKLAKKTKEAPDKEYDEYLTGIPAQLKYTDAICNHYGEAELTEEIADDNYCIMETLLEAYARTYEMPLEKNGKEADKQLFKRYRALTTMQHPAKEKIEDVSTWRSMLHDENVPQYLRGRFLDVEKIIHLNAGNMEGYRHNALTIIANAAFMMGCSRAFCEYLLHRYNNYFTTPLKESELQALLRYQYKHKLNVLFSNTAVADMLGLPEAVINNSLVSYTAEQKQKRRKKYEKERCAVRRRERGFAEKLYIKIFAFLEEYNICKIIKSACEKAEICRSNFYKMCQKYTFLGEFVSGSISLEEAKAHLRKLRKAKKERKDFTEAEIEAKEEKGTREAKRENIQPNKERKSFLDKLFPPEKNAESKRILLETDIEFAKADEMAAESGLPEAEIRLAEVNHYHNQHQVDKSYGCSHGLTSIDDFAKEVAAAMDRKIQENRARLVIQ